MYCNLILKQLITYIAILFYLSSTAQNITSPQIRCLAVLPNGNISVTWQTPPNPAQFGSYQIYAATSAAGSYTQSLSINVYATNNATITGVNANSGAYYLYMRTITSTSVTLPPSDTVRTIFLSPITSSVSIAQLNFSDELPAAQGTSYNVIKEYPVGTWTSLASLPKNANGNINYAYSDTISVCDDTSSYRIEIIDTVLHCTSVSNVRGGRFQDKNKPSTPYVDSVSVINSTPPQVIMGISPAYSQDVKCFMIHVWNINTYTKIDSICNYNQPTTYTTTAYNPAQGPVSLSAISKDSCAGELSIFPSNLQKTIYLHASYDFCNKRAIINWTPYDNMVTGVKSYEIFYSVNGGAYAHLGDTTATVFSQNGLAPGTTYCYYVRAHSIGKTIAGKDTASSTSNLFCITTLNPPLPNVAYLSNVTVNPQQNIDVEWYVNSIDPIGGFTIYRSTSKNGTYSLVKNTAFTRGTGNYTYTDSVVNTNSTEYFYYVVVLDSACKNPAIQTDTSNSILLKANPTPNLTATLHWNDYSKYAGNVTGYNVYRSVNGVFGSPVAFVPSGSNVFVDDLSPYADKEGMFLYYLEAIEGSGNPYGFAEKSWSNYDTVYIDANLYIPNAFDVHGVNKVFLPIGAFVDNADYKLSIYNRWGQKIYETTDPNKGWDGSGHEEDVYAYMVQYKTSVGEYRQRNGTVTLIR